MIILIIIFSIILLLFRKNEYFKDQKYEIYIISLPQSIDRRNILKKTIKYNFKFFDAIDGKNIPNNIKQKYNIDYLKLRPGEIGCFISHLLLWEKIKNNNKSVLILEDDANIIGDIEIDLPTDYDIVFFGHCGEDIGKNVYDNIYKSVYPRCLHGYLVSSSGVKKLIELFKNEKIDFPIDEKIGNFIYQNKLISYTIYPSIIIQNGMTSTIR